MSYAQHFEIVHHMVSAQIYSYEEILEMAPYERDIHMALIERDASKLAAQQAAKQM